MIKPEIFLILLCKVHEKKMISRASFAARTLFQKLSTKQNSAKSFEKVTKRFNSKSTGGADKEKFFNEYGTRPDYLQNKRKTSFFPLFVVAGFVPLVLSPLLVDWWIRSDRENGDNNLKEYLEQKHLKEEMKKDKARHSGEDKVSVASAKKPEVCKYSM